MDWNLYRCSRAGHVTYAPDEPVIRENVHARTADGDLWQCARCGTYVAGPAQGSGPVAQAPVVRRGKEIRSEIILRLFAIERFIRFLAFGALAFGAYLFGHSQRTIQQAFNHEFPFFRTLFRELGYNIDHSSIVGLFRSALHLSHTEIYALAGGLGAFAVVELIEGIGLWLAKRWGEYFAAVVTAAGLPYEIYDLTAKITATRIILFLLNLALVLYLILTKRLFGARGGGRAYEARLRSESIFDAAARTKPGQSSADADAGGADDPGGQEVATGGQEVATGDQAESGGAGRTVVRAVPPVTAAPVGPTDPTTRMTPPDA